jgi:hypothetical protein
MAALQEAADVEADACKTKQKPCKQHSHHRVIDVSFNLPPYAVSFIVMSYGFVCFQSMGTKAAPGSAHYIAFA